MFISLNGSIKISACMEEVLLSKEKILSPTEKRILPYLCLSNPDIAKIFNYTLATVKTHVHSILKKLDAPNRTYALIIAIRTGLVSASDVVLY